MMHPADACQHRCDVDQRHATPRWRSLISNKQIFSFNEQLGEVRPSAEFLPYQSAAADQVMTFTSKTSLTTALATVEKSIRSSVQFSMRRRLRGVVLMIA